MGLVYHEVTQKKINTDKKSSTIIFIFKKCSVCSLYLHNFLQNFIEKRKVKKENWNFVA